MQTQSAPALPSGDLIDAERAIWAGQKLCAGEPLYNMALLVEIHGDLQVGRFARAFESVIRRSDSLRTTFTEIDGLPRRKVLETIGPVLELLDFSAESDPQALLHDWCQTRTKRMFDLTKPLIDCALIRLGTDRHAWFINAHHLITDAASHAVLVREVGNTYRALEDPADREAEPGLPQYSDFLASCQALADSAALTQARAYWEQQQQDLLSVATQGTGLYGPATDAVGAGSVRKMLRLDSRQKEKLRNLATDPRFRAFTPDMTRHNVFATVLFALLHRLNGQNQLVIGVPGSYRSTRSLRDVIGLMVELYPLHVELDRDETFASLFDKARGRSTELLMNMQPGAKSAGAPGTFNLVLNTITARIRFADFATSTRWLHPDAGDPNHHLRLEVHDFDGTGEPELLFDLNRDVFDELQRDNLLEHFQRTLNAFLDSPDTRIADIELSSPAIRQHDKSTQPEAASDQADSGPSLVSVFDERVARHPDRIALVTDGTQLTYHELSDAARRLASELIEQRQVQAGDIVAIFTGRDAETIVSILATLMAGAAYLPIDPVYPDARIALLLDDARPRIALGAGEHEHRVAQFEASFVRTDNTAMQASPGQQVARPVRPSALAYVLYTSGTTGTPNGVLVEHRQVLDLVRALETQVMPAGQDALKIALVAPFVFDASVQQLFSALLLGHSLHIVPDQARLNGSLLREFYATHGIDLSDGTPAHLKLLSDTGSQNQLTLPSRFVLGGDRMTRAQLAGFYRAVSPAQPEIINIYGVAECAVDSASFLVRAEDLTRLEENIPIGKPLPGTEILVVNDADKLQPPEVAGEILIAGPGVARGYLNRPELTSSRFIAHPFRPSQRAYRTGDRGYFDRHGNLHFLGRVDEQIKSRGIRIEPGEIEHHLMCFDEPGPIPINTISASRSQAAEPQRCRHCLLTSAHPQVSFNDDGVCSVCTQWSGFEKAGQAYFQSEADFLALHAQASRERRSGQYSGQYDCMLLYSGGKDSSYVLHRLVELGLKVLAFTFDNGFISNAAFENIRRQTSLLGVDCLIERASAMDDIFVESLLTDSTVCSGCFRALTAISTRLAHEHQINMVVTGLSRGQIFDTKLVGLYQQGITDIESVEENLRLFRRVFHANEDRTARLLDVDLASIDIDNIHFVDFFRYDPAGVNQVRAYLAQRDEAWSQPQDTGFCSSNCVMNDVGICVHGSQKGFHNYEAPLSWDIRLGVSRREEVLPEVTTPVNIRATEKILQRIGFFRRRIQAARVLGQDGTENTDSLSAYYQANQNITADELRRFLARRLPPYLVPSRFIQVERMPYTAHGKVDDRVLRQLDQTPARHNRFQAPTTAVQIQLAEIWSQVLGVRSVGVHDNFFDLGGDSIAAIRIVGRANAIGFALDAPLLLKTQTIAALAAADIGRQRPPQQPASGPLALTPVMHWFLSGTNAVNASRFAQVVSVRLPAWVDKDALNRAFNMVINHHDCFRLTFERDAGGWHAAYKPGQATHLSIQTLGPDGLDDADIERLTKQMAARLDLDSPELIQAALVYRANSHELLVVANHLVVDAVSWSVLLQDLERLCGQISAGQPPTLPEKGYSFQAWANALHQYADNGSLKKDTRFWREQVLSRDYAQPVAPCPQRADLQRHATCIQTSLTREATSRLVNLSSQRKRPTQDLLLLALGLAIHRQTEHHTIRIDIEGHGREPFPGAPDVSRTVGWFTSLYPVVLNFSDATASAVEQPVTLETINLLTDQVRVIPANGFSFGLIHHLPGKAPDYPVNDAPVLFNYLGRLHTGQDGSGSEWEIRKLSLFRPPEMLRRHPLEIAAMISDGQLSTEWTYTDGLEQADAVRSIAAEFDTALDQIISVLENPGSRQRSAVDFPQAKLNTRGMDKLAAALGKADALTKSRGGVQ